MYAIQVICGLDLFEYVIQVIEEDIAKGRLCEGGKTVIYTFVKETRSMI